MNTMTREKTKKKRKLVCSTYLPPDIRKEFYAKCDQGGFTPAEQLRRFVYDYLNN